MKRIAQCGFICTPAKTLANFRPAIQSDILHHRICNHTMEPEIQQPGLGDSMDTINDKQQVRICIRVASAHTHIHIRPPQQEQPSPVAEPSAAQAVDPHHQREEEERNTMATRNILHDANTAQGEENMAMDPTELDDLMSAAEGGGDTATYK